MSRVVGNGEEELVSRGMFSCQNFAKFFKIPRHIESFGRMHETLNIDKK
jgi:hypothetical protein